MSTAILERQEETPIQEMSAVESSKQMSKTSKQSNIDMHFQYQKEIEESKINKLQELPPDIEIVFQQIVNVFLETERSGLHLEAQKLLQQKIKADQQAGQTWEQDETKRKSSKEHNRANKEFGDGTNQILKGGEHLEDGHNRRRSSDQGCVMVVDMGVHDLKGLSNSYLNPNNLVQTLVPGLEDRCRFFPSLQSDKQLSPSYLCAPSSLESTLGRYILGKKAQVRPITLVFCAMDKYNQYVAQDKNIGDNVLEIYNDCVRRVLNSTSGYECQEQEGAYMLAFQEPLDALEWCILVQEIMCEINWPTSILECPQAEVVKGPSGTVTFRGPRVKMGVYQGQPTRVVPHRTTGRADYFGPLVNRAARFCHAAALGGQIIVARDVIDLAIHNWQKGNQKPQMQPNSKQRYIKVNLDPVRTNQGVWLHETQDRKMSYGLSDAAQQKFLQQLVVNMDVQEDFQIETFNYANHRHIDDILSDDNFMADYMVNKRLMQGDWLWVKGITVYDLGKYKFKGVTGVHSIVSVQSFKLKDRQFPLEVKKGKGQMVDQGKGQIYNVQIESSRKSGFDLPHNFQKNSNDEDYNPSYVLSLLSQTDKIQEEEDLESAALLSHTANE